MAFQKLAQIINNDSTRVKMIDGNTFYTNTRENGMEYYAMTGKGEANWFVSVFRSNEKV